MVVLWALPAHRHDGEMVVATMVMMMMMVVVTMMTMTMEMGRWSAWVDDRDDQGMIWQAYNNEHDEYDGDDGLHEMIKLWYDQDDEHDQNGMMIMMAGGDDMVLVMVMTMVIGMWWWGVHEHDEQD